jgi:hypothetical protein
MTSVSMAARSIPQLTPPSPYLLSGLARCAGCCGPIIAMSRHHGRRRGYFYGCAHNWKRGPAICTNNLHLPQAILDEAVVDDASSRRPLLPERVTGGV